MARKKKSVSKVLDKAKSRLAGIRSIEKDLDMGNGNSTAAFDQEINNAEESLEVYNTQLSNVDIYLSEFKKLEKGVAAYSQKMLSAVGSKYGFDSPEYEKAGGIPKSKRRQPRRNGDASPGN